MQQLIDKNWEQLTQQLNKFKEYVILECPPVIEAEAVGAIAAKGFEVKEESVHVVVFVFACMEKRSDAGNKSILSTQFPNSRGFQVSNGEMLVRIFSNRTDDEVKWVVAELSKAFEAKT